VHTSTKTLGLHPIIYFGQEVPNTQNRSRKFDLMINSRTVFSRPKVISSTNLPEFKINSRNGINLLTGEEKESKNIVRIDILLLYLRLNSFLKSLKLHKL